MNELKELRDKRKQSFIEFLQAPENKELRLWQALQVWAYREYKKEFPEKPEIHVIFAGFDQEASDDTFYWE